MAITIEQLANDVPLRDAFVDAMPYTEGMLEFWIAASSGGLGDDLTMQTLLDGWGPNGAHPIDWEALGLGHMVENGYWLEQSDNVHAEGLGRRTVRDLHAEILPKLQPYLESFEFSQGVSTPTAATIGINDVGWPTVAAWNEAIVKELAEGASVKYWQAGERLIIGEQQSEAWRMAVEATNGSEPTGDNFTGWLTMTAKGGGLSAGKITVNGGCDQAAMKASIKAFSNKSVSFV